MNYWQTEAMMPPDLGMAYEKKALLPVYQANEIERSPILIIKEPIRNGIL